MFTIEVLANPFSPTKNHFLVVFNLTKRGRRIPQDSTLCRKSFLPDKKPPLGGFFMEQCILHFEKPIRFLNFKNGNEWGTNAF